MPDNLDQLQLALDFTKGGASCDDLSRRVWGAWGAGRIRDDDAELLQARLNQKRPKQREARGLDSLTRQVMRKSADDLDWTTRQFMRKHGLTRQRHLSVRLDAKPFRDALRDEFGVTKTGAAILLDLCDVPAGRDPDEVSFSLYRGHYEGPNRYKNPIYTYRKVKGATEQLRADDLVDAWISSPQHRGWQSYMIAKPETVERVRKILGGAKPPLAGPVEPIELRAADKSKLDYRESRDRQRDRRVVEMINEGIAGANIENTPVGLMRRIYNNGDFSHGGRFYAMGGGWQTLPKQAREAIKIDGEPVVELDYVAMHPTLIYAMFDKRPPADMYAISAWPRDLVKLAMLVVINADDPTEALHVIAKSNGRSDDPDKRDRELMQAVVSRPGSKEAYAMARKLMEDVAAYHAPIAEAFYTGIGTQLMAFDSGIAARVETEMLRRHGVTVLPVHDSFIVPESKAGLLRETMIKAAHEAGFSALSVK